MHEETTSETVWEYRGKTVVLLERFELSTSPLPRECSTPELQQQSRGGRSLTADGRQGKPRPVARRRKSGDGSHARDRPASEAQPKVLQQEHIMN